MATTSKRPKFSFQAPIHGNSDFFDWLPDNMVLTILVKVAINATCPADLLSVLSTCKRVNGLGLESFVLSKASAETFAVKPRNWSQSAHWFLQRCSDAGNLEASYTLGMIKFYCMRNWITGTQLLMKAARGGHAPSVYSMAIIMFNGSGRSDEDRKLSSGVLLCSHAATLGYIDAIRELGLCYKDGYGVPQNMHKGQRILVKANLCELAAVLSKSPWKLTLSEWLRLNPQHDPRRKEVMVASSPFFSDSGWYLPPPKPHPANLFLIDWFSNQMGVVICANVGCGRPETRLLEFLRCNNCRITKYCSRACRALHWKMRHRLECGPMRNQGIAIMAVN